MRTYVLTVTIQEGNDEFWEAIGKKSGKKEVLEEVQGCLAEHGFYHPECRVTVHDVIRSE